MCVLELASMLGGEAFTDHPDRVCPVIASFLRPYNDTVDDVRRQDLYPYASAVVGTATTDAAVLARRIELITDWGRERLTERTRRSFLPRGLLAFSGRDLVGVSAVRLLRTVDDRVHGLALALLDDLIAVGADADAGQPRRAPMPLSSSRTRNGPEVAGSSGGVASPSPRRRPASSSSSVSIEERVGIQPSSR